MQRCRFKRVVVAICGLSIGAAAATAYSSQPQQRQAQMSWWDRSPAGWFGHYWIKTDLNANEIRPIAERLNLMYAQYSQRMAHLPVRVEEKLNVFVFKKRREYEFTLRARFGLNAAGSGGMFFNTPVGGGLAFFTEGLPMQRVWHVMQHEGFHQFAHSRFGDDLPVWINEGMAEFFGESVLVNGTLVIGQGNPRVIAAVKNAIAHDRCIPFEKMLHMRSREWNASLQEGSSAAQYHQAWSMVHFLVYGDGGRYTPNFETYLRHLNNGLPAREAFVRSFGNDIAAFEARWRTYALNATPSAFVSAMEKIEFLAEGMMELARKKMYPESIEQLKASLRQISFSHTIRTHGLEVTLSAADDAMFEIPRDDLSKDDEQPAFALRKAKPQRLSLKERKLEEENPTPASLATEHLRPRDLHVRWIRQEEDNTWRYEIAVK